MDITKAREEISKLTEDYASFVVTPENKVLITLDGDFSLETLEKILDILKQIGV